MAHGPPAYHESTSPTQTVTREPPSYEPDPALPLPTTFKIGKSYTPPLISVSSIRNHLLLLSCFSTLKQNVQDAPPSLPVELDPEVKWAIYLLRADYRFGVWIDKVVNRSERQRGEVTELTDAQIPPIDVLLLLHAYLLNPVAYYEDSDSRYPGLKLIGGFPLNRVGSRMRKEETQVYYTPTLSQIEEWELRTQEPFELPLSTTLSDTITLACPMCSNPDLTAPWLMEPTLVDLGDTTAVGKGYAQSGFAAECQACGEVVTKATLRAERFVREFVRVRDQIRREKDVWFVNSLINPHTYKPSPSLASSFTKLCVEGIHDLDENPQLSAHIALGSYFDWSLSEAQRLIEAGFKRKGSTRAWMGDSISRLFRAFRHNSSVSVDLPGAALRQQKFTSQILSLGNSVSLTDLITQYHTFLDLCAHHPGKALVPTLVIDLGWHTHMLSGEEYRDDCWRLFEKMVGHEDKVEEGKLASSFEETARLWKSRFGDNYSTCGCIPAPPKPSSTLKFWKKSTLNFDEKPETHPTEHNSIVAINPKKGVADHRRVRAGSVSVLKDRTGFVVGEEHEHAFIGDYANADGKPFSSLGVQGWDIDCIRQPFVVDSNEDRGDCCVGVRISCSTISHMSATGEGAIGTRANYMIQAGAAAAYAGM
ncbi:BAR domain protein, putative [Rhizoctonia solani AG-3 Rhs1AP]|uniref:BAR domain protein, putative n=1 Tax=Rhizoctonia solani AG-3 Rhs1AP TaxID=1086054 RepID=X8JLI9_9AGAM|nr:BAR domain protein, putative [Rhizoctonia solani AG-3 Rhs1AP]